MDAKGKKEGVQQTNSGGIDKMNAQTLGRHEETMGSWHIVLPAKPADANKEISDADLEKVAGGATPFSAALVTAIVVSTGAIATSVSAVGSVVGSAVVTTIDESNGGGGW
jgi:hypothetical protein